MTPREKFEPYVIRYTQDDVVGYLPEEIPILEYQEQCEIIADEFAIGFAEWHLNLSKSDDWEKFDYNTTTKLLEIYKKEKGL